MRRKNSLVVTLTVLGSVCIFLNSCKITQTYQAPKINAQIKDSLYRNYKTDDTSSIGDIQWRSFFNDPYLKALIEEAIVNNYNLKNAILNIASSQSYFNQSKAAFFPSLQFNSSITESKNSQAALNFPSNVNIRLNTTTYSFSLSSNWELDVWGKLASNKRMNFANWLQAAASQQAVQVQLVSTIAQQYYTLLALDEQLSVTQKTIELRKKNVSTIKELKNSAVVTGAAVVQSEANLYAAEVTIPDIKQSIQEVENSLSVVLGRTPGPITRGKLADQALTNNLEVGVPIALLKNRPDVLSAELAFRAAFENTNYAKTFFYPSITLTSASLGASSLTRNNFFTDPIFFSLVGGLTQPIFNRRINKTQLEVAKVKQEQALNNFYNTVLKAGEEVSNALARYNSAREKESIRTKQIDALTKAVEYNTLLMQYSSATNYTDVLTSEQSLLTAQLSEINDRVQKLNALIALYVSLGGGKE